jgi:hypothetical protein
MISRVDLDFGKELQSIFNRDNIEVRCGLKQIWVYWFRNRGDTQPWFGDYSGGMVISTVKWQRLHIMSYRKLIPEALRKFAVVVGEMRDGEFHCCHCMGWGETLLPTAHSIPCPNCGRLTWPNLGVNCPAGMAWTLCTAKSELPDPRLSDPISWNQFLKSNH